MPIILTSITYFLFNNSFFGFWNIIAIFLLFIIMLVVALTEEKQIYRWFGKIISVIFSPLEYIDEAISCIIDNIFKKQEKQENSNENRKNIRKIILGIIVAIPILLIILILLSSADTIFAKEVGEVFKVFNQIFRFTTITNLMFRIAIIVVLAIYFVAFLYNLIEDKEGKIAENAPVKVRFKYLYNKKNSLEKETFQNFNINRYMAHEKLKTIRERNIY